MKLINPHGEEVYYNVVIKHDRYRYVVAAANEATVILGRDRQRRKSRTFAQESQALAYLDRHGYTPA